MSENTPRALIFLERLQQNAKGLQALSAKDNFFCPMIKTNAYGHGLIPIAKALVEVGIKSLGVGSVYEGIELRRQGIKSQILIFRPVELHEIKFLKEYNLTAVVSSLVQLKEIHNEGPLRIHLKFNTGMNRLGLVREDIEESLALLKQKSKIELEGLCTHLASGEEINDSSGSARSQLKLFEEFITYFPKGKLTHVFNSSALLMMGTSGDLEKRHGSRPGLALYGVSPIETNNFGLKPVMSLMAKLLSIQFVKKGEQVSYGGTFTAKQDMQVGVLGIGYGDGFPRSLSNQGFVYYENKKLPVVGRVCMDYTMIDCLDLRLKRGDDVEIFGGEDSTQLWTAAKAAGTIPYELITCLSPRVSRTYIYAKDHSFLS